MVVTGLRAPVADRHPPARRLAIAGVEAEAAHRLPGHLGPLVVAQVAVHLALGRQRQVPARTPRYLGPVQRARGLHGRLEAFQFGQRRAQPTTDAEGRGRRDDVGALVLVVPAGREQIAHGLARFVTPRDLRDHSPPPFPPPPERALRVRHEEPGERHQALHRRLHFGNASLDASGDLPPLVA